VNWFVELKRGLSEKMTAFMVVEGPWDMYAHALAPAVFVSCMYVFVMV
jgi:hypothetical protein